MFSSIALCKMVYMKLQSSLEFLSSYSFLLVIITLAIGTAIVIAISTRSVSPAQCTQFGGLMCNFADLYYNSSSGNSLATLSVANAQDAPLNISNVSISISNTSYTGNCIPNVLYQGSDATCSAILPSLLYSPNMRSGFYTVNARYCSGLFTPGIGIPCASNVSYKGAFIAYTPKSGILVFSAAAGLGNETVPLESYPSEPSMPSSYAVLQNGEWVTHRSSKVFGYAYGSGAFLGQQYLGMGVISYPQGLSMLGRSVACTAPYNSMLSTAYTIYYVPVSQSVNVSAYTDNSIEVYYKSDSSGSWSSVFNGALWSGGTIGSNAIITLSPGLYDIAVVWSNGCGAPLQAFRLEKI